MQHRLQVFCLGPPKIILDTRDITLAFETNAARGLLIYLCLNKNRTHSRSQLANLLWPDLSPARSLKTFSQTLNRVRSALKDRNVEEPIIILHGHKNIELNPAYKHWLDIAEFTQYLKNCENHHHYRLVGCPICLEWLQRAASLYQTDFLAGFELSSELYCTWASGQSHTFHRQAMELFYMLIQCYEYLGDYKNAQIAARRQLILEPWNEEVHCQLMQNYVLDGKRSAALAQYHECCQVLQAEFDVKPSKSTNQLYIDICNEVPFILSEFTPTLHNLPASPRTFVGRERELNQLLHLLLDPANRLVTITGLGGVGKTHLAIAGAEKAATSFMNGVIFVDLSQILPDNLETYTMELFVLAVAYVLRDVEEIWNTFCSSLDHMPPMSALLDCFADKELLIVLDDFVQCPALADCIWQIVNHTTNVVVLITSRYPADIYGEKIFPLYGLTCPSDELIDNSTHTPEMLLEKYESVKLFILRVSERGTNLVLNAQNMQAVAEICQQVDGSPLAIEMAATKINRYSLQEIAYQTRINLDILQLKFVGVAQSHRSMKAILLDAWQRLTQDECALLWQLVGNLPDTIAYISPKQLISLKKLAMYTLLYRDKDGVYRVPRLVHQFIVTYPIFVYHRTM